MSCKWNHSHVRLAMGLVRIIPWRASSGGCEGQEFVCFYCCVVCRDVPQFSKSQSPVEGLLDCFLSYRFFLHNWNNSAPRSPFRNVARIYKVLTRAWGCQPFLTHPFIPEQFRAVWVRVLSPLCTRKQPGSGTWNSCADHSESEQLRLFDSSTEGSIFSTFHRNQLNAVIVVFYNCSQFAQCTISCTCTILNT